MAYYSTQQANTSTKRTYRIYIGMLVVYNTRTMMGNGVFDALVQCVRCLFVLMVYLQARRKIRAKKIAFLRAARRRAFIYAFCAFFVSRIHVWHSLFLFLVFVLSFLSLFVFVFCVSIIFVLVFGSCFLWHSSFFVCDTRTIIENGVFGALRSLLSFFS